MNNKLIVGIDGSECAEHALAWALTNVCKGTADIQLVCCWERPLLIDATGMATTVLTDEQLAAQAQQSLDHALSRFSDEVDAVRAGGGAVSSRVMMGAPDDVLEEESKKADCVVIGRRGHSKLAKLLGTVSRHVADNARCPVVVVPEVPKTT
jgi:nucleotide-binding universal stress UspA family protein